MEGEKIICIFCGRIAKIEEQDDLRIVVCPKCKRETELNTYQGITQMLSHQIKLIF